MTKIKLSSSLVAKTIAFSRNRQDSLHWRNWKLSIKINCKIILTNSKNLMMSFFSSMVFSVLSARVSTLLDNLTIRGLNPALWHQQELCKFYGWQYSWYISTFLIRIKTENWTTLRRIKLLNVSFHLLLSLQNGLTWTKDNTNWSENKNIKWPKLGVHDCKRKKLAAS